jgi:hypothetical protein
MANGAVQVPVHGDWIKTAACLIAPMCRNL